MSDANAVSTRRSKKTMTMYFCPNQGQHVQAMDILGDAKMSWNYILAKQAISESWSKTIWSLKEGFLNTTEGMDNKLRT